MPCPFHLPAPHNSPPAAEPKTALEVHQLLEQVFGPIVRETSKAIVELPGTDLTEIIEDILSDKKREPQVGPTIPLDVLVKIRSPKVFELSLNSSIKQGTAVEREVPGAASFNNQCFTDLLDSNDVFGNILHKILVPSIYQAGVGIFLRDTDIQVSNTFDLQRFPEAENIYRQCRDFFDRNFSPTDIGRTIEDTLPRKGGESPYYDYLKKLGLNIPDPTLRRHIVCTWLRKIFTPAIKDFHVWLFRNAWNTPENDIFITYINNLTPEIQEQLSPIIQSWETNVDKRMHTFHKHWMQHTHYFRKAPTQVWSNIEMLQENEGLMFGDKSFIMLPVGAYGERWAKTLVITTRIILEHINQPDVNQQIRDYTDKYRALIEKHTARGQEVKEMRDPNALHYQNGPLATLNEGITSLAQALCLATGQRVPGIPSAIELAKKIARNGLIGELAQESRMGFVSPFVFAGNIFTQPVLASNTGEISLDTQFMNEVFSQFQIDQSRYVTIDPSAPKGCPVHSYLNGLAKVFVSIATQVDRILSE